MDYTEIIEFEQLALPISESSPSGIDPRTDITPTSVYYRFKDIRSQARANERRLLIEEDDCHALIGEWRPMAV